MMDAIRRRHSSLLVIKLPITCQLITRTRAELATRVDMNIQHDTQQQHQQHVMIIRIETLVERSILYFEHTSDASDAMHDTTASMPQNITSRRASDHVDDVPLPTVTAITVSPVAPDASPITPSDTYISIPPITRRASVSHDTTPSRHPHLLAPLAAIGNGLKALVTPFSPAPPTGTGTSTSTSIATTRSAPTSPSPSKRALHSKEQDASPGVKLRWIPVTGHDARHHSITSTTTAQLTSPSRSRFSSITSTHTQPRTVIREFPFRPVLSWGQHIVHTRTYYIMFACLAVLSQIVLVSETLSGNTALIVVCQAFCWGALVLEMSRFGEKHMATHHTHAICHICHMPHATRTCSCLM